MMRMATCKECFHYEMCFLESVRMGKYQDVETRCDQFKNKADVVSKKAYEQVKWERDTAIEQLNSYGVDFCEKADVVPVVRCSQCRKRYTTECALWFSQLDDNQYFCGAIHNDDFYCSYGERE